MLWLLMILVPVDVILSDNPSGSSSETILVNFKKAEEECAKEKNISPELLNKTSKGDFAEADANKMNCFTECLFTKVQFVKDGSVSIEMETLKNFAKEKGGARFVNTVEKCAAEIGTDICDLSYKVYKCYSQDNAIQLLVDMADTLVPVSRPAPAVTGMLEAAYQAQQNKTTEQTTEQSKSTVERRLPTLDYAMSEQHTTTQPQAQQTISSTQQSQTQQSSSSSSTQQPQGQQPSSSSSTQQLHGGVETKPWYMGVAAPI